MCVVLFKHTSAHLEPSAIVWLTKLVRMTSAHELVPLFGPPFGVHKTAIWASTCFGLPFRCTYIWCLSMRHRLHCVRVGPPNRWACEDYFEFVNRPVLTVTDETFKMFRKPETRHLNGMYLILIICILFIIIFSSYIRCYVSRSVESIPLDAALYSIAWARRRLACKRVQQMTHW